MTSLTDEPYFTPVMYESWQEWFDAVQSDAAKLGMKPSDFPPSQRLIDRLGEMPRPPWESV